MIRLMLFFIITACFACGETTSSSAVAVSQLESATPTAPPAAVTIPEPDSTQMAFLMGKFDPTNHPDFVAVPKQYTDGAQDYRLHRATLEAFIPMFEAAKSAGISLKIRSATRNFDRQKQIWEGKWTGKRLVSNGRENLAKTTPEPVKRARRILEFSSMPGSSRHHWGTDIDINAFENSYFEAGNGLAEYEWLVANAATYGFCQPYTAGRQSGYNEEKWHWSFLPIAQPLTNLAKAHLENTDFSGFMGAPTAQEIEVVQNYVLGINPDCLGD